MRASDLLGGRVVVVAPHFDDEVLGCGGVISSLGSSVSVAFVCGRTYGHMPSKTETEVALKQSKDARRVLGYGSSTFGGLEDEYLSESIVDVVSFLEAVREEFEPGVVLIPSRKDVNMDHRVVFDASMIAFNGVGVVLSYYVPSSSERSASYVPFAPGVVVRLDEGAVEKKIEAMGCYEEESREFPSPRSPEGIRCAAMFFGMSVGCENGAEPFELVRAIV